MALKEHYLVGLDVGTSKMAAIVAEALDDGGLDIIGIGVVEAQVSRRGVVVNLEAAVESSKKAIEEAELTAGVGWKRAKEPQACCRQRPRLGCAVLRDRSGSTLS